MPFGVEKTEDPLVARGGLVVVNEMAQALGIPQAVDRELPPPGSGRGYKPSQFVMPMVLMFHGGGRKLEDLQEFEAEVSLRGLASLMGHLLRFDARIMPHLTSEEQPVLIHFPMSVSQY